MSSAKCARCEQTVYPVEGLRCLDKIWHKGCFKCHECNMTLNMKNYKGFEKRPYCNAHCPQAKATTVADTPESRRLAENTRIQSQAKYHEDFEKSKGKGFTPIADDPETLRLKNTSKIISNVAYHGELERKKHMEERRTMGGPEDRPNGHPNSNSNNNNSAQQKNRMSLPVSGHETSADFHVDENAVRGQYQMQQQQQQQQMKQQQQQLQAQQKQQQLKQQLLRQQQIHYAQEMQQNGQQRPDAHHLAPQQSPIKQQQQQHVQQAAHYPVGPNAQQHHQQQQQQQQQQYQLLRQQQLQQHRQSLDLQNLPSIRQQAKQSQQPQLIKQQSMVAGSHAQLPANFMPATSHESLQHHHHQMSPAHLLGGPPPAPMHMQMAPAPNGQRLMAGNPAMMAAAVAAGQAHPPPPHHLIHGYQPGVPSLGAHGVLAAANGALSKQQYMSAVQQQQHQHHLHQQQQQQQRNSMQVHPSQIQAQPGSHHPAAMRPHSQQFHPHHLQPAAGGQIPRRVYRAMFDYVANDVDEVSFFENDILVDCVNVDGNWLIGKVARSGQTGMLPANYVAEFSA